jgi:hypothetical protein
MKDLDFCNGRPEPVRALSKETAAMVLNQFLRKGVIEREQELRDL